MRYIKKFNESITNDLREIRFMFSTAHRALQPNTEPDYRIEQQADGSINYYGNLFFSRNFFNANGIEDLTRLPFKIDKVIGGSMIIQTHSITTLEGCPNYVEGNFYCSRSYITDLNGSPQVVGGDFVIPSNRHLISLQGGPKFVGGLYDVTSCKLTSLVGAPEEVQKFVCSDNQLTDLVGSPVSVTADFKCTYNSKLTSLKGCPRYIGDEFNIDNCKNLWDPSDFRDCQVAEGKFMYSGGLPLALLMNLFNTDADFKNSLDYNYIKGPDKIDLFKFKEALDEIGIDYEREMESASGRHYGRDWMYQIGNYKFVNERGREVSFRGELVE